MWYVGDINMVPVNLDFSSSGQSPSKKTAVYSDKVCLINALELVEYDSVATQVLVCEQCGVTQCQQGGWVTFRRIGDAVIWLPGWTKLELGDWELTEFSPPAYMENKGAPIFSAALWENIREINSDFPNLDAIPSLNSREAARTIQWSAPGRILGTYPDAVKLRREFLIAVSDGDLSEQANLIDKLLADYMTIPTELDAIALSTDLKPIEFYLELPGTPGWLMFAQSRDDIALMLDEATALIANV